MGMYGGGQGSGPSHPDGVGQMTNPISILFWKSLTESVMSKMILSAL